MSLLAWQYRVYPEGHRDRVNLLLHLITAPLFCVAMIGFVIFAVWRAPLASIGWALVAFAVLVLQARGHAREATPPHPIKGPGDLIARFFAEQFITFPRYVLGGGWLAAWRAAQAPLPPAGGNETAP
jgi:hypothetical protein